VLISGSWYRAFDNNSSEGDSGNNNSGDNDNGGDSDNSNSVRPILLLTNNSLYSSKAGLIQLSVNINWATYSNIDNASNSNNGPKD